MVKIYIFVDYTEFFDFCKENQFSLEIRKSSGFSFQGEVQKNVWWTSGNGLWKQF